MRKNGIQSVRSCELAEIIFMSVEIKNVQNSVEKT